MTALPTYRVTTATAHYWFEGEAWLDQGQTGTCVGNALAHRYADGPVDHTGINEAWAQELYVAASGDTTLQQGTSALLACRVMLSRKQISAFHWVGSPAEFRNTLLTVGPVCVGVDWYSSMDRPLRGANDRAYMVVDPASGLRGGHEFEINGINLAPASGPPFYRMKNSWGRVWPGDEISGTPILGPGTARFACYDLENLIFSHGGDAVLISEVP